MLHPDYQCTPKICQSIASILSEGIFDCALGSRILGQGALKGGMPLHKYISNRVLTAFQNYLQPLKICDVHRDRDVAFHAAENLELSAQQQFAQQVGALCVLCDGQRRLLAVFSRQGA